VLNYLQDGLIPRRFHDDALIHSFETLLQEQIPYHAPIETVSSEKPLAASVVEPHIAASPWSVPIRSPLPFVHFVTNGRLGTMVTNAGSGYCTWLENDVTRWRSDTTLDGHGSWIYLQDVESGELWSLGEQPISDSTHHREVSFHPQKVAFQCTARGISARMELLVATEDDVEIRRVKITNDTSRSRRIRIASYSEMVLAPREADRRHPAFTKLFVESDFDKAAASSYFPGVLAIQKTKGCMWRTPWSWRKARILPSPMKRIDGPSSVETAVAGIHWHWKTHSGSLGRRWAPHAIRSPP